MTEQNLGKDFETLLGMLRPEESVNKDDVKTMKEQIFGPNVFWVTETRATDDILDGGIVVCLSALPSLLYALLVWGSTVQLSASDFHKQHLVKPCDTNTMLRMPVSLQGMPQLCVCTPCCKP